MSGLIQDCAKIKIAVYAFDNTRKFQRIGYVKITKLDDRTEYLSVVTPDIEEATVFTYITTNTVSYIGGVYKSPIIRPDNIGVQNQCIPDLNLTVLTGDYIMLGGNGLEFNPLLSTRTSTEYNYSVYNRWWSLHLRDNVDTPASDVRYGEIYRILLRGDGESLGRITRNIKSGAHLKTIYAGQLRFGVLGSPDDIELSFEPVS